MSSTRVAETVDRARPDTGTIVPIQHIDDAEVKLLRPFLVVLTDEDDGFLCRFPDCNINATGDTHFEATENLKDILIATFKRLERTPTTQLGTVPIKQQRALHEFLEMQAGYAEGPAELARGLRHPLPLA